MSQGPRNLHHVLLRDAQAAGRHIGVEVGTQLAQYRRRPRAQFRPVHETTLGRLRIDEQVLRDRKVVERQAFLVNHADAQSARRVRGGDAHRIAIETDFTTVGLIDAGQYLHQRGFTGAVLADQRGDRTPPQLETHTLQGSHTAE